MINVEMSGLTDALNSIPGGSEIQNMIDVIADMSLFEIEAQAKTVTPVDTGKLRGSLLVHTGGLARGYVRTNTNYAVYVHEGWGTNAHKGRRPFMEQGVKNAYPEIKRIIERQLNSTYRA